MVGTNVGASQYARARRIAWIGAGLAMLITESIGIAAAMFPRAWLSLFTSDAVVLATGARYLETVGPTYGFFGLGLALYFASQGAGRLLWPLVAGFGRLVIATAAGVFVITHGGDLNALFVVMAAALVFFGSTLAIAVHRGAWTSR
jgi:MATE family, multidrug efflux pump